MRLRKRKVDKVINEAFWDGFQKGLGGGSVGALEYSSDSGWYSYNGVRDIAERAGHAEACRLLDEHVRRIDGHDKRLYLSGYTYKIPASVVAECYAEARLAP